MALPKYEQIAASVRGQIVRGELAPGDALPSENEIRAQWQVSRATVVKGLDVLRYEGLIETRKGTGSVVRERTLLARTAGERYRTSVDTGYVCTTGEHSSIISSGMVPAPEDVASALGVQVGEEVARRHRVTFEGEVATSFSFSWFTADVAAQAPRLLQLERIREGTTRYVEMATGRVPHTGRSWWTARLAGSEELELLGLDGPQAVAEERHVAYCAEGVPLTFEVGVWPGGRWARTEEYSMTG